MDIVQYCEICNLKIAKYICKLCGKNVCEDHYNKDKKVCTDCFKV